MANGGQGISPQAMLAIIWTLASLATVLLAGRLFVRRVVHRSFHADDLFVILAWFLMVVVMITATISNPLAYRFTSVLVGEAPMPSPEEWVDMTLDLRRWSVSAQVLFWTSLFCVKISFMCLYRLVGISATKTYKRAWWISMAYIVSSYGLCLVGVFAQCGNAADLFTYDKCASKYATELIAKVIWVACFFNVTSDLLVVLLPLPLIWSLKDIRLSQRLALLGICSLALVTVAFDVVRTVKLSRANPNLTTLYGYLELLVTVIISTLPTYGLAISSTEKSREQRRLLWSRITLASFRSTPSIEHNRHDRDTGDSKQTDLNVKDGTC